MTKLLKETEIKVGAAIIKDGGIVAFRTETVYGLGADATNAVAVKKIFTAKSRPTTNPLIIHFCSLNSLKKYFPELSLMQLKLLTKLKSSLTMILDKPKSSEIASIALAGQNTVAVRIPECKFARKFIKACGVPLAAPSANTSSRPSPTRWQDVYDDLNKRIDAIYTGRRTKIGLESTVIQVASDRIKVLRLGGVTIKKLEKTSKLPVEIIIASEKSPGAKHKHYTPSVPLHVLSREQILEQIKDGNNVVLCLAKNKKHYKSTSLIVLGKSAVQVQYNLFYAMREAEKLIIDKRGNNIGFEKASEKIFVEAMPETAVFQTVRERFEKASCDGK